MDDVRQFMGVCPQHDVLFDLLTPEEHLDVFCDFKGVPKNEKKAQIDQIIKDIDLGGMRKSRAHELSGGNRRKLSIAIALIGDSKFILLDEPTAGIDLSGRRKMWDMLKKYKNGRIIILTTHYMDEADILGDRVGIMAHGQITCLGRSLFLKNRFGVGYRLNMVKKDKETNIKIADYIREHLGPEVQKLSEISSEVTF
jgi:ATP-binding cassette subfamily A (ABC1) protein 3